MSRPSKFAHKFIGQDMFQVSLGVIVMTSNEHKDHQPDDSDNPFSSSRVWDTWLPYVVRAGNDSFMTSL